MLGNLSVKGVPSCPLVMLKMRPLLDKVPLAGPGFVLK